MVRKDGGEVSRQIQPLLGAISESVSAIEKVEILSGFEDELNGPTVAFPRGVSFLHHADNIEIVLTNITVNQQLQQVQQICKVLWVQVNSGCLTIQQPAPIPENIWFTTFDQTTKHGKVLPCCCRTEKEQVFSSFILPFTHSTERILPDNSDSVKMLPQVTMVKEDTDLLRREGQMPPRGKVTVAFSSSSGPDGVSTFSQVQHEPTLRQPQGIQT
ncbi:hypothetical protein J6590_025662 [Homalodisca vitripennis]|nr:hypothetical protein J6590_025662 [Homalodisca vitripennis]